MIGNKVPGHGPIPCGVMICGEGPGANESVQGIPFCGASGSELDWLFLRRGAGIDRSDVYVTNIVKWRTDEEDSDPTPEDIARDEEELDAEIMVVNPRVIVAVGRIAAQWFMQTDKVDMERYFGTPVPCPRYPEKVLIVTYHPAAGLRQPERYYDKIFWAFQQLGAFVRGEISVTSPVCVPTIREESKDWSIGGVVAVDTEGSPESPWGMSWSVDPKEGWVVKGGSIPLAGRSIEAHNVLYDVKVFRALGEEIDLYRCDDTMLMAYLFPWLPRALKPLMFKLCGLEQRDYEEVISEAEAKVSKKYLNEVLAKVCPDCGGTGSVSEPYKRNPNKFKSVKCVRCGGDGTGWPLPEPELIFNPDSTSRVYKPRSIGRRVRDLCERGDRIREGWLSINETVRAPVERGLGPIPEATLDDVDPTVAVQYAGLDACGTRAVSQVLNSWIDKQGLRTVYEIDKGILPIIDRMHRNGILVDKDHFQRLHDQFSSEAVVIGDKLSAIAGYSFNPSSPKQVGEFLYGDLGLKAPRGIPSTDEKTLGTLKLKYPNRPDVQEIAELLIDYRELAKLLGTYVDVLPAMADSNGRVHTQFMLHVTSSGRLSSRDPNLQNQPTRSERGQTIRRGFIAKPGCSLVSVDLDQIELRVAAHLAEDENMIDVFRTGKDIHRRTASLIYSKPMEEVTTQERLLSKTINFLILYGGSARKLQQELTLLGIKVTLDECIGFINAWFQAYPGIREYMDRCHQMAESTGYVECLFGRRRYLPGVHSTIDKVREESLRWSVNHPDQATAAGILKLWMRGIDTNVVPQVARYGYCEPLLTVHDEVVFEVEKGLEELLIGLVVAEAAASMDLLVPIAAKGGYGYSWDELK